MNLNEQADRAVRELMRETREDPSEITLVLLRLAWLDGHKAGADTVSVMARDAFAQQDAS